MDMYNRKIHGNKSFVYTMLSNNYAFKYLEENSISKYISKFFLPIEKLKYGKSEQSIL